jgi:hypothetical protein
MSGNPSSALALAFQIAAMGLASATIALAILGAGGAGSYAVIPAIAIFSLAIGSLMHQRSARAG